MSQHLNLKYFLQSTDFRDRHMHACTQQCFHGIEWSLRKFRHFLDIKHKQQTSKKPLPRLGLELQSRTQQMSSWLNASPAQTSFGHWLRSRRQRQHNQQNFDNVSLKRLCLGELESRSPLNRLIDLKGEISQTGPYSSWTSLTWPGDISLPRLQASLLQGLIWSYPRFELSKWQVWEKPHLHPQNKKVFGAL